MPREYRYVDAVDLLILYVSCYSSYRHALTHTPYRVSYSFL